MRLEFSFSQTKGTSIKENCRPRNPQQYASKFHPAEHKRDRVDYHHHVGFMSGMQGSYDSQNPIMMRCIKKIKNKSHMTIQEIQGKKKGKKKKKKHLRKPNLFRDKNTQKLDTGRNFLNPVKGM